MRKVDFEYFGLSDIGVVRSKNEDFWFVNLVSKVVAIADGMGGCSGGEVASQEAVLCLMALIDANIAFLETVGDEEYQAVLRDILAKVNNLVYQHSLEDVHLKGMGTTLSFLHFFRNKAWLFHVGDSRIYLLREKKLFCLTEDHSVANQLTHRYGLSKQSPKVYPYRHILTNVVGNRPYITPDVRDISYEKEDVFIFCSDGLTNMVTDIDIRDVLIQSQTLEESGHHLISLANSRGGLDNATLVLVRMR